MANLYTTVLLERFFPQALCQIITGYTTFCSSCGLVIQNHHNVCLHCVVKRKFGLGDDEMYIFYDEIHGLCATVEEDRRNFIRCMEEELRHRTVPHFEYASLLTTRDEYVKLYAAPSACIKGKGGRIDINHRKRTLYFNGERVTNRRFGVFVQPRWIYLNEKLRFVLELVDLWPFGSSLFEDPH